MVRRHNVIELMKSGDWDRKAFATKSKVKYATLSTFLGEKPKGNIGTKVANTIEASLGKSIGWLDKDRRLATTGDTTTTPAVSSSRPSNCHTTISMEADTLTLVNHPITNYQRDAIIALLFTDN